jgi:hypothetical protein
VALWLKVNNESVPAPEHIDPLDPGILADPGLRSGKTYFFFDALLYLNLLPRSLLELAPPNSHTRLNIDGPDRPNFNFAIAAAVKRTQIEFFRVVASLSAEFGKLFTDL